MLSVRCLPFTEPTTNPSAKMHFFKFAVVLSILAITPNSNGVPQGTVPPEFQCSRTCYLCPFECNSLSYLVETAPNCWRCCLKPAEPTMTTTITTTTTCTMYGYTQTIVYPTAS
ncbi:unnamed protein product [Cyclocybe aegerita]|uniref:Uncharacterized protein n=1 Tax=Cyclocybe aegerita TaxID=1973307 RepID=A0A8S0XRK0_CYCAE|nr:unnamed protein product [Cyclocybe aegerita]